MRIKRPLFVFVAALALAVVAPAQIWEKSIAPGLIYRMEVDLATPRIVHALRFSQGSPTLKLSSELADGTVYSDNPTKGRETVTEMVTRTGALAGVNGDFFPFTGQPLGAMVREGELLSVPSRSRAVFGWGPKDALPGLVQFQGSIEIGGTKLDLDGFNQECPLNKLVLNTDVAALAVAKSPCLHAVIKMDSDDWKPNGTYTGTFQSLFKDTPKLPIQPGNVVVTACGTKMAALQSLATGQQVTFRLQTNGFDWSKIDQTIGGGPFLVRNGHIDVDAKNEGFNDEFIDNHHPRTAIGKTADGDIWLVVVDGRQKISDGASLGDLAKVMVKLGCVDAINLDGGGSSALNILGLTVNRPSDGKERPVANGVLVFGPKPDPSAAPLKLLLPSKIEVGAPVTFTVLDGEGKAVPNAEILWSSSGDAWIDQGGLVRPIQRGKMDVAALVRGQLLKANLDVTEPTPKPPVKARAGSKNSRGKKGGKGG